MTPQPSSTPCTLTAPPVAVIHEFDPWFNMRATQYLADNGIEKFFKWYDHQVSSAAWRALEGLAHKSCIGPAAHHLLCLRAPSH